MMQALGVRSIDQYNARVKKELEAGNTTFRLKPKPGEEEGVEGYLLYHDGRALDLAEVVRDQAFLARPMSSLCRPACSGLCALCGSDLNEGACSCVARGIGESPGPGRTSLRKDR